MALAQGVSTQVLVPPWHCPATQVLPVVHCAKQGVPSATGVYVHAPVAGSHPVFKQGDSGAGHALGGARHLPWSPHEPLPDAHSPAPDVQGCPTRLARI